MKTAIVNIGTIVSGDWRAPLAQGDTIITLDAKIETVKTWDACSYSAHYAP
jgi:enamidase